MVMVLISLPEHFWRSSVQVLGTNQWGLLGDDLL